MSGKSQHKNVGFKLNEATNFCHETYHNNLERIRKPLKELQCLLNDIEHGLTSTIFSHEHFVGLEGFLVTNEKKEAYFIPRKKGDTPIKLKILD